MYRQQRLHTRVAKKFSVLVEYFVPGGGLMMRRQKALTKDVSRGGCCSIQVSTELSARTRVLVTLDLPTEETGLPTPLQVKSPAVVRWCRKLDDGQFEAGLAFADMPKNQIAVWDDMIHRWTAGEF